MSNNHFDAVYALMSPSRVIVGDGAFGRQTMAPPSERDIQSAQVWATLAVAYEQRTANLIALLTAGPVSLRDGSIGISDERLMELQQEVLGRLAAE